MKTKYCVCNIGASGMPEIIKRFRNKPEAVAFIADEKNTRQYGDMMLVEQAKHGNPAERIPEGEEAAVI